MKSELPPGTVINVGGGSSVSINELFRVMKTSIGSAIEARHAPARAGDVLHSLASIQRARELLGFRPNVSWRDGLAQTVAWYQKQHALARS
jgi:nucleoside-diphosphate-sugar epimerase